MLGLLYLSLPFLIPIVVFCSLCIIGVIGIAVWRYVAYRFFDKKIPAIWYSVSFILPLFVLIVLRLYYTQEEMSDNFMRYLGF